MARPVEIIIGFFVFATSSSRGISVISGEATLYAGQFNFSRIFIEDLSKTEAKIVTLFFLQYLNIDGNQLSGVCAFL